MQALKINTLTYPIYVNVLKVIGFEPIEDKARVNNTFVVIQKIVVLGTLPVWKVDYYNELDFRKFFRWGEEGAKLDQFTAVEERVTDEDDE